MTSAYVWVVILVPALGVSLLIWFATTGTFKSYRKEAWFDHGEAAYTAHDVACDVLIFGDSTAVTGLNTRLIQRESGLKTCNIAQSLAVLSVLQLAPLDVFLAHNPRPKYIVLQFASDDLAPFDAWRGFYVDGLYDLLWHFPAETSARGIAGHPDSLFALSGAVLAESRRHASGVFRPQRARPAAALNDELPDTFFTVPLPASTHCMGHDDRRPNHVADPNWVQALRARYRSSAARVLVNVAPTADCDADYAAVREQLTGITDNEFDRVPIRMFNDRLVHFSAEGSTRLSRALVRQLSSLTPEKDAVGIASTAGDGAHAL